ncbi:beta-lactamase/transpeptidase-like protein [Nemania abortiva]|nr:beta-lactamase/transpeptidase-like protein [Nemania abortiva]
MSTDLSIDAIRSRVEALSSSLDAIRLNTGSASISVGVVHQDEVIFTHSYGFRDVKKQLPADSDTTYLLASVTKAFIAAACGILVDEGKLQWSSPLSNYIAFRNKNDEYIGNRATLQDALSHATGLAHLDLTWLGVEGHTIASLDDILEIVSHLPTVSGLRGGLHYNNYMYSVVGQVIETVAGCPWHEFLRRRILDPLGMNRTTTNRNKLKDENLAEPHVVVDDHSIFQIKPVDVSDDTAMGAAGGVWSSVSDMILWAKALLKEMKRDTAVQDEENFSPLKQIPTITAHRNPITSSSLHENTYALGFARAVTPSTELGWISLNGPQRDLVMGKKSPSRLVLYHNGGQSGYLSSFYLFPETGSAIVALGNTYGLGDGPDWTCQAIMQAMFDLKPEIDFVKASKLRAQYEFERYERLANDFAIHRHVSILDQPKLTDFLGRFRNYGLKMTLDITLPDVADKGPKEEFLILTVNELSSQQHRLEHYNGDSLGFLPLTRQELIVREMIDWFEWYQFVLKFIRDTKSGRVTSLLWKMQVGLPGVTFQLE